MQDSIQREITIKAPKERVYEAITDPAQIITWFPDSIDGGLSKGDKPFLHFGEHDKTQIYVVAAQPHDYFSYRWVPGGNTFDGDIASVPTTLVEFRITETDGGSVVTLTESGFASLPADIIEASFKQNSGGWDFMMERLEKKFAEA
ncbi:MAG: Aha1 domain superfamily [Candidatus Saccharibacteria bacterium]|nr:Aha1 domain superfamily [Candidatus Saccharibacteria bacterium]